MFISLEYALAHANGATWVSFTCPHHDDAKPSARVNTISGKYVCMVCSKKGKTDTYDPPERMVIDKVRQLDKEKKVLSESYLDMFDTGGPGEYWSQRFSPEACQQFRLGYDESKEKSVYPIRDSQGGLLGLVYRNFPGEKPKYRYPRGVSTSELLFNWENMPAQTPIVLVEGAPDVIALWEARVPAVGSYGARLLPAQQRLLSRLSPSVVLVAYDMDPAGHTGSREAVEALLRLGIPAVRVWWSGYNDLGEMPTDIARDTIKKSLAQGLTLV